CLELLNRAERDVELQIETLGKLTGTYSGLTSTISSIARLIDFIIAELQSITIWHRPEYAVTWTGVLNVTNDITTFLKDVRSYVTRMSPALVMAQIKKTLFDPLQLLILILKIIVVFACLMVFKWVALHVKHMLALARERSRGIMRFSAGFMEVVIRF